MYKILIFLVIVLLFAFISFKKIITNKNQCGKCLVKTSKLTYRWHLICLVICFVLFSLILYADVTKNINKYLPTIIFEAFIGVMAGICLYAIIMYAFTPIGIYDNGVITHFVFLPMDTIEAFKVEDYNLINIGNNKTIVFKIFYNTVNHPSIEISRKEETIFREALKDLDEINFKTEK